MAGTCRIDFPFCVLFSCLVFLTGGVPAPTLQEGLVSKTANMAFALIHCDAEADEDEEYQACKKCFNDITDFNSEEGLGDAKECVENYFPIAQVKS